MLPDRFADRSKISNESIAVGPFVEKMGQGSQQQDKNGANDHMVLQLFHNITSRNSI